MDGTNVEPVLTPQASHPAHYTAGGSKGGRRDRSQACIGHDVHVAARKAEGSVAERQRAESGRDEEPLLEFGVHLCVRTRMTTCVHLLELMLAGG